MGLHLALCARCQSAEPAAARPPGGPCARLLSRRGDPDQALPRGQRYGTGSARRSVGRLEALRAGASAEDIQNVVYAVGKRHAFADLRAWFQSLYEILIGQSTGPRMGSFIALYGIRETIALIRRVLAGENLNAA